MAALAGCWSPPPLDTARQPVDLTFQVSFKRSGELFGKPRVVNFAPAGHAGRARALLNGGRRGVDRCSPMPFTDSMGGAVAGRTFRVNFHRQTQQQEGRGPMADNETS